MQFTRRETLALGAGAALLTVLPYRANAAVEDFVTEFTADLFLSRRGVFNDVVQYGGDQGVLVHVHFCENICDFKRMLDVGFAAEP